MAMTCSHKILKGHSNEAPSHNAAGAERSEEAGPAPSLRHRGQRVFLPALQLIVVWWRSNPILTYMRACLHLSCNTNKIPNTATLCWTLNPNHMGDNTLIASRPTSMTRSHTANASWLSQELPND